MIVCESDNLTIDESWLPLPPVGAVTLQPQLLKMPAAEEKRIIEAALAAAGGRVSGPTGAAARLGVPPSTLDSKIQALKIDKHRYKTYASDA